jgi:hypothetical protein
MGVLQEVSQGSCKPLLIFDLLLKPFVTGAEISNDTGNKPVSEYQYNHISKHLATLKPGGDLCVCLHHYTERSVACLIPYVWNIIVLECKLAGTSSMLTNCQNTSALTCLLCLIYCFLVHSQLTTQCTFLLFFFTSKPAMCRFLAKLLLLLLLLLL